MGRLRDWLRRCVLRGGFVALVAMVAPLATAAMVACDGDDAPPIGIPGSAQGFDPGFGAAGRIALCPTGEPTPSSVPVATSTSTSMQLTAPAVRADRPPPPISGGTLIRTADATKLVAADPDRDAIYVIDIASRSLERRIALHTGDEPGRLVEDGAGRVHVVLRGARSLATLDLRSPGEPRRSEVCDLPRGIAYDAPRDRLYVACADGTLARVDPKSGARDRKVELGRDLRDVVSHEDGLFVSRFRAAELVRLDPESGAVVGVSTPPDSIESNTVVGATCASISVSRPLQATAEVAWRSIDLPGRGVVMLHQRAQTTDVHTSPGGYGETASCGHGIVRSAITILGGLIPLEDSIDLNTGGLFVDLAIDPTASVVAVANAGGWGTNIGAQVFLLPSARSTAGVACASALRTLTAEGQVTALAFITPELLAVQLREPAGVAFYEWPATVPESLSAGLTPATLLDLKQPARVDSGHTLFHVVTSAGLACASCHPEAGDDGHVWSFSGFGLRRTQNLRGGILGTAPFHWSGALRDFPALIDEVFLKRMNGPFLRPDQGNLLAQWIDAQPALRSTPPDPEAVERGKTMFESDALGCTQCHSGDHFTNNQNTFVGTGAVIQVPSLLGVSFRAPYVHNGCARTLSERYGSCGGGDKHGHTDQLSEGEKSDLDAYLESL